MPTRLILIRHGLTDWNLEKRYISYTDIDLNGTGRKQARRLSKILSKENVHQVYSSTSIRAINFARIIFKGLPIKRSAYLREINFGIFEGLTHKEIMHRYPKVYSAWLRDPLNTAIPKGEDLRDFRKRILRIFNKIILLNKDKTIAIVTHGGVIRVILNQPMPRPANINIVQID